ncbi:peptidase M16 [Sphingomonas sp. Leaf17]|uniref:M16 family metallopeptidase n=1 Tax=Sphingomonas sp. Leaf17 TaxID=1735683 RepID=UPI0006F1F323|nr:pitrilysin family protein [Sphingomonas sp. Leaf17]KQM64351.1 peptidase M16 [Sphingomonas sp. Leaf17]
MNLKAFALGSAAVVAFVSPAIAQQAAPVSTLVKSVDIPYQQFTLKNGLRVVVHTDRKAPVVAVSVWYDVGSKHEPKGKTGFAHLFEHLMFNGSENAPGDFFEPLKQVGATDFNGTTYYDRTNYFETVPTAALDRALYLESDRMGYLLGAVTQGVLDEQRGVVQNEKRQGDNRPYGLIQYKVTEGLFPAGHPYGHTTIGSMADLDAASLDTVKQWFTDNYGPNNAVLVLAGDIDVATAKPLVEKYFGAIKPGRKAVLPNAPIPTLAAPVNEVMKDNVAATLITRNWAVPGLNDPDSAALTVAGRVLGGLASSRLDNALVKKEKLAVQVSADNSDFAQVGMFDITVLVRPGVDPAVVSKRVDEILAEFLKNGPTADEVNRVATQAVSSRVKGLESVGGFGGKAVALAEGALYSNDPGFYKKQLLAIAAQTPATVKAAANKWLTRPAYTLTVEKGAREAYVDAAGPAAGPAKAPVAVPAAPEQAVKGTRAPLPGVGTIAGLTFPTVQRAKLNNGIELVYAQRTAVPVTNAVLSFDAGVAADVPDKLGTQALTLNLMDEGTTTKDSIALAEAKERLGASIGTGASADRTFLSLSVPSANLNPALDLFADIARNPAFAEAEVARLRTTQLAGIQQELTSPEGLAGRVVPKIAYGPSSPYAKQFGGGDPKAVAALTRADLVAFQQAWLRPDKAKIFVTSDRPLAEVQAALNTRFGNWTPTGPAGVKTFGAQDPALAPKIILVDRPDSPQSLISGVIRTGLVGTDDLLPVATANDALGGGFLGRLNMDLREDKHWSYGVGGNFARNAMAAPYIVRAPVQADKTGASIAALRGDIGDFVTTKPMTQVEFDRAINGAIRSLSGNFETSNAVLGAMQQNDLYKRPDNYYSTITQRYQGFTLPQMNSVIQKAIDPKAITWVVVGDAAKVKPQLDTLGLPVEVVPAASVADAK